MLQNDTPGPNVYETSAMKKANSAITIGKAKKMTEYSTIDCSPGPGDYNI